MAHILKDVKVEWAKLEDSNPDKGYQNAGPDAWMIDVILSPKATLEWNTFGITSPAIKVNKNGDSVVRIKRKVFWKSGDRKAPVVVVDGQNMPFGIEDRGIGNGSLCNVQLTSFAWEGGGRSGVSAELVAVQVVSLIEFAKREALAFGVVDTSYAPAADVQPTSAPVSAPIELDTDTENLF